MAVRIQKEFKQAGADGETLHVLLTWPLPSTWRDNITGKIVDPWAETILPTATAAIAAVAGGPGDLAAVAKSLRQELVLSLKGFQPDRMQVWRASDPGLCIISTW